MRRARSAVGAPAAGSLTGRSRASGAVEEPHDRGEGGTLSLVWASEKARWGRAGVRCAPAVPPGVRGARLWETGPRAH